MSFTERIRENVNRLDVIYDEPLKLERRKIFLLSEIKRIEGMVKELRKAQKTLNR